MQCFNGVHTEKNGIVPCGQCMPCRINTGRKWTGRILMETITTPGPSYFQTFTYADQALPLAQNTDYVPTLRKKPFLRWLANQQRETGPFRYYAVGEYGEKYGRPHYHIALFPTGPTQVLQLRTAWRRRFGFTDEAELTPMRAGYLAQYAAKKLTRPDDFRLEENQEPEFRTSSRHPPIGADFVGALVDRYSQKGPAELVKRRGDIERTFRIHGRIYPLGDWVLRKTRLSLGIPVRHEDRILNNPNYLDFHQLQEAEQCAIKHHNQERHLVTKKKRVRWITRTL